MSDGSSTLKKGCVFGCIGLVLLGIVLVLSGVAWFGSLFRDFDQAIETRKTLEQQLGAREAFVPWTDGSVPPWLLPPLTS